MQRDSKNVIFNYANDIQLKQEVALLLGGKNPKKGPFLPFFLHENEKKNGMFPIFS